MEKTKFYPKKVGADFLDRLQEQGISPLTEAGATRVHPEADSPGVTVIMDVADEAKIDSIISTYDSSVEELNIERRANSARVDLLRMRDFARRTTAPTALETFQFNKSVARSILRLRGELRDEDEN